MRYYQPNSACSCGRCSTRGLMGPAVLVTLGVLFLLANSSGYPFERTWPILLIVIGAIKVVQYVLPDSGHFNPGQYPPPPYQAGVSAAGQQAAPVAEPVVIPPPAPHADAPGEGNGEQNEVRNG